jgi:hypothetical protein
MYRRKDNKMPEYKLVMNEKKNFKIDIGNMRTEECTEQVEKALRKHVSIEDYLDNVYEKDITTHYKKKKVGLRPVEFEEVGEPEIIENQEIEEIVPVPKKLVPKKKKLPQKMALEFEEVGEPEIIEGQEIEEFVPAPKKKTKKLGLNVNPPGHRGTKKKRPPIEFEIVEEPQP